MGYNDAVDEIQDQRRKVLARAQNYADKNGFILREIEPVEVTPDGCIFPHSEMYYQRMDYHLVTTASKFGKDYQESKTKTEKQRWLPPRERRKLNKKLKKEAKHEVPTLPLALIKFVRSNVNDQVEMREKALSEQLFKDKIERSEMDWDGILPFAILLGIQWVLLAIPLAVFLVQMAMNGGRCSGIGLAADIYPFVTLLTMFETYYGMKFRHDGDTGHGTMAMLSICFARGLCCLVCGEIYLSGYVLEMIASMKLEWIVALVTIGVYLILLVGDLMWLVGGIKERRAETYLFVNTTGDQRRMIKELENLAQPYVEFLKDEASEPTAPAQPVAQRVICNYCGSVINHAEDLPDGRKKYVCQFCHHDQLG